MVESRPLSAKGVFSIFLLIIVAVGISFSCALFLVSDDLRFKMRKSQTTEWGQSYFAHMKAIKNSSNPTNPFEVDALFLWVNGSDPMHIQKFEQTFRKPLTDSMRRRFRDYGTLRFGVRSIEKFAPWIRNLIIVTDGQVPSWWNKNNPRGRIVTHEQIFRMQQEEKEGMESVLIDRALPTFNSNAIEANLMNIPGISPFVLYLNDDMLLGRNLSLSRFLDTKTGELKLRYGRFKAPEKRLSIYNIWHASVSHSNELINQHFYGNKDAKRHYYTTHFCYFLSSDVLKRIGTVWENEWLRTSRSKVRDDNDLSIPFLHMNMAYEEGIATLIPGESDNGYGVLKNDEKANEATFTNMFGNPNKMAQCLCLQDGMDALYDDTIVKKEMFRLQNVLCKFLPDKSSFEDPDEPNPCHN